MGHNLALNRWRSVTIAVAAVTCSVFVGGVGEGTAAARTAAATESSSDGFARTPIRSAKVSLLVPKSWTAGDLSKQQIRRLTRGLRDTDPDFVEFVATLVESGEFDGTKWVARDPLNGDNIRVSVFPDLTLSSPADVEAASTNDTLTDAGIELIGVHETTVRGKPALQFDQRLQLSDPDVAPAYCSNLWILMRPGYGVFVTVVVDDTPDGRAVADQILGSVRPL